ALVCKLCEQRRDFAVAMIRRARAAHNEHARGVELADEEHQKTQRRLVGALEIIEHQHKGLVRCGARKKARHAVEETEACWHRPNGRGEWQIWQPLSKLGKHFCDVRRTRAEQRAQRGRVAPLQCGAQNLI
ncbi:MAG: hypothetical protein RL701_3711, partial [Pseudomonadota bacterium]